MNYYNEFDPRAAAWLRELINQKLIPDGTIDTRSIVEVQPEDLHGFTQCHFFAGIGGWPQALRLAGWPDDQPVWTGSCPCQPFSTAGKQKGEADSRHLWPEFRRLVSECRPSVVFGEQVASKLGREWLAGVRADLEGLGYAVGASDLCAASVGAPHIRQRLYWVGNADGRGLGIGMQSDGEAIQNPPNWSACGANIDGPIKVRQRLGHADVGVADPEHSFGREISGPEQDVFDGSDAGRQEAYGEPGARSEVCRLEHPQSDGWEQRGAESGGRGAFCGRLSDFWSDYRVIPFTDGKSRRIESGIEPLAHGIPGRVGLLRGYGNAIVPQVAAAFIKAFASAVDDLTHGAKDVTVTRMAKTKKFCAEQSEFFPEIVRAEQTKKLTNAIVRILSNPRWIGAYDVQIGVLDSISEHVSKLKASADFAAQQVETGSANGVVPQ